MSNEEVKQILIREMAETTKPLEAFEIAIKAVERKNIGHWEETVYKSIDQTGEVYRSGNGLKCSNCNHCFKSELLWTKNYCPHCGARMEEHNYGGSV